MFKVDHTITPKIPGHSPEQVKLNITHDSISQFSNLELPFLYDVFYSEQIHGVLDINFYVEEAKKLGDSIFEVGIGTGRIAIELAKSGKNIDGIDISASNLQLLQNKLDKLPENIAKNVTFYMGDILHFPQQKKYDAILFSFRCMQHFYKLEDQIKILKWARDHLNNNGKIFIDVFYPNLTIFNAHIGEETLFYQCLDKNNQLLEKYYKKLQVHEKDQFFSGSWIYKIYVDNKVDRVLEEKFEMCYYTYFQLKLLFKLCELHIEEEFGSFDRKMAVGQGPEMIFILSKEDKGIELANIHNKA